MGKDGSSVLINRFPNATATQPQAHSQATLTCTTCVHYQHGNTSVEYNDLAI